MNLPAYKAGYQKENPNKTSNGIYASLRQGKQALILSKCGRFFRIPTLYFVGDAMFSIQDIVERKIWEALKKGEFDDLPGKGRPMHLQDDGHIPEDLRLAYKILKNGDCLPPEIEEKKQIQQMEDLLEDIKDEKEKYKLIKRINFKIMKLNMTRKASPLFEEKQLYYKKVLEKMGRG